MIDQNTTLPSKRPMRIPEKQPSNIIFTAVVGVTFGMRQYQISRLHILEDLWLRREPDNPYDGNAIHVERKNGTSVGYLNRFMAAEYAPIFDAYGEPVPAWVVNFTYHGRRCSTTGVRIGFVLPQEV